MNRTERLLDLLQVLRSNRYPVSGQKLAERLNVSIRTLYRDIATLQAQGAEITGESGVGYVLKPGYFMPPLMFSETEVEALLLGIQWVSTFGDRSLSNAAGHVLSKIREVLPRNVKDGMGAVPLRVGPPASKALQEENLSKLREAIRRERKMRIKYIEGDEEAETVIWPFAIGYFTESRILACWCESRQSYRHFRTNSLISFAVLSEGFPRRREVLFREWQEKQLAKINHKSPVSVS